MGMSRRDNVNMQKILLTEGSSLTSRETLTALRNCGYKIDILSSVRFPMSAFSRWRHRIIRTVNINQEPHVWLEHVAALVEKEKYAAVLPTHEEAWLIAEGRGLLPPDFPVAVASAKAFARTQSKLSFAELLDELGIPQPAWRPVVEGHDITLPFPLWVKAAYGTAGRSVQKVQNKAGLTEAVNWFSALEHNCLMVQENIKGQYGQVQAIFDQGRMVAVHTTVQTGTGVGNSAAARKSVDFPQTRLHMQRIGEHLHWHGPITIDFIHTNGNPLYIECNPRMIEPGNAEVVGVNFPDLLVNLAQGKPLGESLRIGMENIHTHSLQALLLGAAEQYGTRRELLHTMCHYGFQKDNTEVLTPILRDLPSIIPFVVVLAALLFSPRNVSKIAAATVNSYSVLPETIRRIYSEA